MQTVAARGSLGSWVWKNGSNVQQFKISFAHALHSSIAPPDGIFYIIRELNQLTSLDLSSSMRYLPGSEISTLMAKLPQLKVLRLEDVVVPANMLTRLQPPLEVPAIALLIDIQRAVAEAAT